jgi:hypothetical protein
MAIDWKKVATEAILADGTIDENEVRILQRAIKGAESDEGVSFLLELRKAYARKAKGGAMSDAFENFFFKAVQGHVVKEGKLDARGVGYLKDTLFPGARVDDRGHRFLTELNKKTKDKAPEFTKFMEDVEKKRSKAKK